MRHEGKSAPASNDGVGYIGSHMVVECMIIDRHQAPLRRAMAPDLSNGRYVRFPGWAHKLANRKRRCDENLLS